MTDLGFPVGTNEHGLSAGLATVQAVYPETSWQVVTNIPVYNIPLEQLMNSCWRFNTLYTILENNSGSLSWQEGLDALEQVHLNCPWSAIYDMSNVAMYFIVHNNYDDPIYVNLDDFEFIMPVGISDFEQAGNSHKLSIFPNPFSTITTINYFVEEENSVNLVIYDINGNKVRTLVDNRPQSGKQNIKWDKTNDQGAKVSSGIYSCQLKLGQESTTIKLIVTD